MPFPVAAGSYKHIVTDEPPHGKTLALADTGHHVGEQVENMRLNPLAQNAARGPHTSTTEVGSLSGDRLYAIL